MISASDLVAVPVFSKVEIADLARVAGSAADVRLAVGEYVAHEGDQRALYVVLSGKIEVTKTVLEEGLVGSAPVTLRSRSPGLSCPAWRGLSGPG